jgi:hypothetical protein
MDEIERAFSTYRIGEKSTYHFSFGKFECKKLFENLQVNDRIIIKRILKK